MTNAPMRELRRLVEKLGSQRAASLALGVSEVFIHQVLYRKRHMSKRLALRLGYQRVVTYRRVVEYVKDSKMAQAGKDGS